MRKLPLAQKFDYNLARAWFRSFIKSFTSSKPTDNLITSSPAPASIFWFLVNWLWVVDAGCRIRLLVSPTLATCENIFTLSIGYLYWPAALIIVMMTIFFAPIGARLAHYLPIEILKRIFAVLLMFIGVKMLI